MNRSTWLTWVMVLGSACSMAACDAGVVDEEPDELPPGKYEAWNAANNPAYVDSTFVYDTAALPVKGQTAQAPTPGDYWATAADSINVRWDGDSSLSPAEKVEKALDKTGFAKAVTNNFGIYSGSRKACNSASDCEDQNDGSDCVTPRGVTGDKVGRCIPGWWGICHGWSPFAISEPAPTHAITRNGVTFYPGDLEGIMSLVYSQSLPTKFISTRCDKENLPVDANGRVVAGECRDMNPGTMHVVLSNFLGLRKTGLVEDRTWDLQVWNQPVRGFEVTNAQAGKLVEISKADAIARLGLGMSYTNLVSNVTVAKDATQSGSYAAPAAGDVLIKMTGTGDADLYVKVGSAPSTSAYDCRPYTGESNEECTVHANAGDKVYWMASGYAATSTVTVAVGKPDPTATYVYNTSAARFFYVEADVHYISESSPAHESHVQVVDQYTRTDSYQYILEADAAGKIVGGEWVGASREAHPDFMWWPNGKPTGTLPGGLTYADAKSLIDESAGATNVMTGGSTTLLNNEVVSGVSKYFPVGVPGGKTLKVTSSGTGDVDLYVKLGTRPSLTYFTAKSTTTGTSSESLSVTAPAAGGTYYVRVRPMASSSTVTVTYTIQ
jgi:hypothetical protein